MGRDDWYRNVEWTDAIAAAFEAKLMRARRKAQYLRIQACCLARSDPRVALELLDRYFQLDEPFDHAQAHVDRATAFATLGRLEDAARAYEDALRREAEFPNLKTEAYLSLPFLIATAPLPERFDQALSIVDRSIERLMFPVDVFRWNAAYALILSARSQGASASAYAAAALDAAAREHSGFRYHPDVGLVGDRHPELVRRLERLANGA